MAVASQAQHPFTTVAAVAVDIGAAQRGCGGGGGGLSEKAKKGGSSLRKLTMAIREGGSVPSKTHSDWVEITSKG